MISQKLLIYLKECIHLYDEKCGKDYVIVFAKGKKDIPQYCQITFHYFNFWHLLGCKLIGKDHAKIFSRCKNGEDISGELSLVHSYSEAYTKCEIFSKVFDFVSNAKYIKIGYVADCPEKIYLSMALGNETGIIGYDYIKGNRQFLIPKTVQKKKISSVSVETSKILFILSKAQSQKTYTKVEYEIKKGVIKNYLSQISADIEISDRYNLS